MMNKEFTGALIGLVLGSFILGCDDTDGAAPETDTGSATNTGDISGTNTQTEDAIGSDTGTPDGGEVETGTESPIDSPTDTDGTDHGEPEECVDLAGPECSADNWQRVSPPITTGVMRDVWASAEDDVFVVSTTGR